MPYFITDYFDLYYIIYFIQINRSQSLRSGKKRNQINAAAKRTEQKQRAWEPTATVAVHFVVTC